MQKLMIWYNQVYMYLYVLTNTKIAVASTNLKRNIRLLSAGWLSIVKFTTLLLSDETSELAKYLV